MKGEILEAQSREAVASAVRGRKKMRGSRRAAMTIAASVTPEEMAAIMKHVKRGGYESVAEYVRAVALHPRAEFDTEAARIATPLAKASYHLSLGEVAKVQRVIADALLALRRDHEDEIRELL